MNFSRSIARALHSLSLRSPQDYAIRSGLRAYASGRAHNALFWSVFTSSEYLSFVPFLVKAGIKPVVWIDCGAAVGYVTLLFNHLIRSGVLTWEIEKQICIEPSKTNCQILTMNVADNDLRADVVLGLVGKKSGSEIFFQDDQHPWSSSVKGLERGGKPASRNYHDLTSVLSSGKECIMKIDIEGSEYSFIDTYRDNLQNVSAMIIEFHKEMGDREAAGELLKGAGLHWAHSSMDKNNREVCLYLRK
jgi:FkbM family methyltransferase